MKGVIHALEPLWWGLFVTGTFLSALLLPGYLLGVTLLVPLGFADAELLSYERIHALASGILGRAFLAALVVTCLWNGAHHLRHFSIDLGGLERDTGVAVLLYTIAGLGSVFALAAVVRL